MKRSIYSNLPMFLVYLLQLCDISMAEYTHKPNSLVTKLKRTTFCPPKWLVDKDNNNCFLLYTFPNTWISARQKCKALGTFDSFTDLADMTSDNQRFLAGKGVNLTEMTVWTGLNDRQTEGRYESNLGNKVGTIQWATDQPNDNTFSNENQDCLASNGEVGMTDLDCDTSRARAVCQIKEANPCLKDHGGCGFSAICIPSGPRERRCMCDPGYEMRNLHCFPINVCKQNNGGCNHICEYNKAGAKRKCSCRRGYSLMYNNMQCIDNNECQRRNGGCQQVCLNLAGSHTCGCVEGFLKINATHCEFAGKATIKPRYVFYPVAALLLSSFILLIGAATRFSRGTVSPCCSHLEINKKGKFKKNVRFTPSSSQPRAKTGSVETVLSEDIQTVPKSKGMNTLLRFKHRSWKTYMTRKSTTVD